MKEMTKYEIIFKEGKSFKCSDLSEDHIKNLKSCDCVLDVKITKERVKN